MFLLLLFVLWVLILILLRKSKMHFFKFVVGSIGLFCFMMYLGRNSIEGYLEYGVTWGIGVLGNITGLFYSHPQYSMISIYRMGQAISFFVDYECSGFVETLVYVSLLLFYPVYKAKEKIKYLFAGCSYILISNIIRVFVICFITRQWGSSMFFLSHTVFARLLFFALMVILYYYVFTRPHIIRQKVGNLSYGN